MTTPARGKRERPAASLASLLALALLVPAALPARAAGGEAATGLTAPDSALGFDRNTVGEVQGQAAGLVVPDQGLVRFRLQTASGPYLVVTAPPWYWRQLKLPLADGVEVVVEGSKSLAADGERIVVARCLRLLPDGRTMVFRDYRGRPMWEIGPRPGQPRQP
ncbi:MAG: hypothetical protein AB1634_14450 [Thermodesulfobacteriota bacterium]